MCHKHVRSFSVFLAVLLALGFSTQTRAGDLDAFHAAIDRVNQPYKSALFYLRTGNAGVAGLELFSAGAAWKSVVDRYAKSPPDALSGDADWMNTVKAVFGVMLLAVAVWLLERVIPAPVTLALRCS